MNYTKKIEQALEAEDLALAVNLWQAAKEQHGAEADYAVAGATIQMAEGDVEGARQALCAATGHHPEDGELWYSLGSVCYAAGRFQEAYDAYGRAQLYLGDPELQAQLAALVAELREKPGVRPAPELTVLTMEDLARMDLSRKVKTTEDVYFLLHRLAFGVKAKEARAALKRAVEKGLVLKADLLGYAARQPLHAEALTRTIREML